MRRLIGLLSAVALGMALACGTEGSGGTTGTPDPDEGKTVKKTVTADDGGTVATESGGAKVDIPKKALDKDTEITIKVEPAAGDAKASIYEFGPDGLTFQNPVTVSIKFDGDPGSDHHAALGWYSGNAWTEVENSKLENGFVSGKVKHFSKFTVIFVKDEAVLVSDCKDVVSGFEPCGGDVTGTWTYTDICLADDVVLGENPIADICPDATLTFDVEMTGTAAFDGSTMTMSGGTTTVTTEIKIPDSCLGTDVTCDTVTDFIGDAQCVSEGGFCTCTKTDSHQGEGEQTVSYTIDGNEIVMQEESGENHVPYCITGDQVVSEGVDMFGEGTGTVYMVLKKQ